MTGPKRRYNCRYCPEWFTNPMKLGGHMAAGHPEHRRATRAERVARPLVPARGPRPGGSLKRDTDIWPNRP